MEEKNGFLYYSDRVSRVEVDIPVAERLTTELPNPSPSSATSPRGRAQVVLDRPASDDTDLPDEEHPISFLIRDAERKWTEMVNRQSKTLVDAVQEYRSRYGRAPPKGFDDW